MPSPGPTRREFVLLVVLLVSLVYVTRNHLGASVRQVPYPPKNRNTGISTKPIKPEALNTHLVWETEPPSTDIIAHVPGWTIYDRLYFLNGTLFVVSDTPEAVPEPKYMISKGVNIENGAEAEASRLPSEKELQIISTKQAKQLFGNEAGLIDGVTFLVNDPPQFITHYYHWSAELWFGFWRTYSSLDPTITSDGKTKLAPLDRIMFSHLDADHWRDYASMNQYVVRASFPSLTAEFIDDWRDRAELARPFVLNRVILADRSASMLGYNYQRSQRTASLPFALPGSLHWWSTIRNNVVQFSGMSRDAGAGTLNTPVITYISRQEWGRRMLIPADHEKLVRELHKLRDERGWEVNIVRAETMSRVEQIQLAARTTILMGVHGNGLTSLIWMKPTPRSTVMEFFYPEGFAHDYEFTTRALGMVHYGFWGDKHFTSPSTPLPHYPEGFQGNSIPIDGELVARLCVERLTLSVENDD